MQRVITGLLALALVAWPAMAGTTKDAGTPAAKPAGTANAAKPDNAAPSEPAAKPESPSMELQLGQLRSLLEGQAEELRAQRAALLEQQKKMDALEEQLRTAKSGVAANPGGANPAGAAPAGVAPAADVSLTAAAPAAEQGDKAEQGPASIRYKGITITPGGFIAAETVFRSKAVGGDINTPFTGIPFPGNALSQVSENNFTARQSRVSLLAEGKVGSARLTGYYEADWLGTGVTSNNRQSNSYVLRQRTIWGQVALDSGWSFTGGQMWSLATESGNGNPEKTVMGIAARGEKIPLTIDSQYTVGFTWEREYGFRVAKDFNSKVSLAFAVEGPQATVGGRGFSSTTSTTVGSASVSTTGNTFINAPGAGGGLFNFVDTSNYTINKSPDLIFKAAFDPGYGHYELIGILSPFRARVYPCGVVGTNTTDTVPGTTSIACPINGSFSPSSIGAFNDGRTGGGFGANMRLPLFNKKLDVAVQALAGDGVGRFGSAQLADLTFRPDGTAALIRTAHALGELEWHPSPKLDVYGYWGAEYAWRAAYQGYNAITVTKTPAIPPTVGPPATTGSPATTTTTFKMNQIGGYGSPFADNSGCSTELAPSNQITPSSGSHCAGDTRIISELTLGFWHKFYQGPKGNFRWGIQYSYFTKIGWSGNNSSSGVPGPGISPKATNNMVWTSFRYYIP